MPVPNQVEVGAGVVYLALYNQLKADTALTEYCKPEWMLAEYNPAVADYPYAIFMEPAQETLGNYTNGLLVGAKITISVYAIVHEKNDYSGKIFTGFSDDTPGLMQFIRDVRRAVEADQTLGLTRYGSSEGTALTNGQATLSADARYLTILLNDNRTPPSGYDTIDCGTGTLAGATIAANIQASLQALDNGANTYGSATCTFNSTTNKLKIESAGRTGARSSVQISAGASASALAVLGFSSPTEIRGREVKVATLDNVLFESRDFPTRWAILQFAIDYEDWIRN
jgi:hypothetical protein